MVVLSEPQVSRPEPCPYLLDRKLRYAFFLAREVTNVELELLLSTGWRKFGIYYFRPFCDNCRACVPVRVRVHEFQVSDSQKKAIRRNRATDVRFSDILYNEQVFDVYKEHSLSRFGKCPTKDEYISNLCTLSCPTIQSLYYIDNSLAGAGFIDQSEQALSSVYFVFGDCFSRFSLGVFSVITEIAHAAALGLDYYYLGYFIKGCNRMEYKTQFNPQERYDWESREWLI